VCLMHAVKGICLECIVSCAVFVCVVSLGGVGESFFVLSAEKSSGSGPGGLRRVLMGDGGDWPEAPMVAQFVS